MISFTLENKNRMIQLCCDEQGLNELIAKLHKLKEVGHLHLWSLEAKGVLSDKDPFGNPAITDVSMTMGGDPIEREQR